MGLLTETFGSWYVADDEGAVDEHLLYSFLAELPDDYDIVIMDHPELRFDDVRVSERVCVTSMDAAKMSKTFAVSQTYWERISKGDPIESCKIYAALPGVMKPPVTPLAVAQNGPFLLNRVVQLPLCMWALLFAGVGSVVGFNTSLLATYFAADGFALTVEHGNVMSRLKDNGWLFAAYATGCLFKR